MAARCLEVTVGSTAGLKENRASTRNDPFAIVRLADVSYRTDTGGAAGARPVWNHRFSFLLPADTRDAPPLEIVGRRLAYVVGPIGDRTPSELGSLHREQGRVQLKNLEVEIWDRLEVGGDKFIGSCQVALAEVYQLGAADSVQAVYRKSGKLLGHIRFHLSLLVEDPSVDRRSESPSSPKHRHLTPPPNRPANRNTPPGRMRSPAASAAAWGAAQSMGLNRSSPIDRGSSPLETSGSWQANPELRASPGVPGGGAEALGGLWKQVQVALQQAQLQQLQSQLVMQLQQASMARAGGAHPAGNSGNPFLDHAPGLGRSSSFTSGETRASLPQDQQQPTYQEAQQLAAVARARQAAHQFSQNFQLPEPGRPQPAPLRLLPSQEAPAPRAPARHDAAARRAPPHAERVERPPTPPTEPGPLPPPPQLSQPALPSRAENPPLPAKATEDTSGPRRAAQEILATAAPAPAFGAGSPVAMKRVAKPPPLDLDALPPPAVPAHSNSHLPSPSTLASPPLSAIGSPALWTSLPTPPAGLASIFSPSSPLFKAAFSNLKPLPPLTQHDDALHSSKGPFEAVLFSQPEADMGGHRGAFSSPFDTLVSHDIQELFSPLPACSQVAKPGGAPPSSGSGMMGVPRLPSPSPLVRESSSLTRQGSSGGWFSSQDSTAEALSRAFWGQKDVPQAQAPVKSAEGGRHGDDGADAKLAADSADVAAAGAGDVLPAASSRSANDAWSRRKQLPVAGEAGSVSAVGAGYPAEQLSKQNPLQQQRKEAGAGATLEAGGLKRNLSDDLDLDFELTTPRGGTLPTESLAPWAEMKRPRLKS